MKQDETAMKRSGKGSLPAAVILLILLVIGSSACGGHRVPVPSVDISGVSEVDGQNAEKYVVVRRTDGKTDQVPMDPEDANRGVAWSIVVDGIPYVSYGEVRAEKIVLDELKGWWINDHFYRYVYSIKGLDPQEWLIDVRDIGKAEPSAADYESMMVYKAIGVKEIPQQLQGCSRYHRQ